MSYPRSLFRLDKNREIGRLKKVFTDTVHIVSPMSILKNPMILIAGVSMILVFGMPYIMDNSKLSPLPLPVCREAWLIRYSG